MATGQDILERLSFLFSRFMKTTQVFNKRVLQVLVWRDIEFWGSVLLKTLNAGKSSLIYIRILRQRETIPQPPNLIHRPLDLVGTKMLKHLTNQSLVFLNNEENLFEKQGTNQSVRRVERKCVFLTGERSSCNLMWSGASGNLNSHYLSPFSPNNLFTKTGS